MARKQIEARIGDLRILTIPAVPEHLPIAAARKVAELKRVADLFVERDGRLVGVLDARALAAADEDDDVAATMTSSTRSPARASRRSGVPRGPAPPRERTFHPTAPLRVSVVMCVFISWWRASP